MSKADGLDNVIFTSKELEEQGSNPKEKITVDKEDLIATGRRAALSALMAAKKRKQPPQKPVSEKISPLGETARKTLIQGIAEGASDLNIEQIKKALSSLEAKIVKKMNGGISWTLEFAKSYPNLSPEEIIAMFENFAIGEIRTIEALIDKFKKGLPQKS